MLEDPDELHTADAAAGILGVTTRDLAHLIARGWLRIYAWKHDDDVQVPLYRRGDLTALRDHPGIPWTAIRAVPAGRRSLIATLPDPGNPPPRR
jgi:hypothetical protein